MKRFLRSIIACICGMTIVFSSAVPLAFARDGVIGGIVDGAQSFCEWSINSMNAGQNAFWRVIFGDDFNSASEEELKTAYDTYVSDLPAQGYSSNGSLVWSPVPCAMKYVSNYDGAVACEHVLESEKGDFNYSKATINVSFNCSANSMVVTPKSGSNSSSYAYAYFYYDQVAPITGFYSRLPTNVVSARALSSSGSSLHPSFFDNLYEKTSRVYYSAGDSFPYPSKRFCLCLQSQTSFSFGYLFLQGLPPVYEIIPVASLSDTTYNINTRPTSITGGNYGIVGDNNQITKVEDNSSIVNETNNTYYNPATGVTAPITNWSYDYSDRSYKLTLDGGKTSSVTYGDENITITETTVNESGDTITNNYTIYYLIDGSGSENPPSTCEHTWTETSSTPATCIMPGSRLSTCSKCQQTKKESIPALGHDWQEKQTVTTQYDETGQLVQKGYTIYECSRCHEQYKSEDGTGPPDTPPEDPGEEEEKKGFFSWLWSVLTDALKKLIEGIIDAILKTLDFFFGGDSQSNYDFYNSPSTFSGVSVWGS